MTARAPLRLLAAARARPLRWDLLPRVSRAAARMQRLLAAHLGGPGAPSWNAVPGALLAAFGGRAPRVELGVPYAFERGELAARLALTPWAAVRVRRPDGRGFALVVDGAFVARLAARLLAARAELPAPRAATAAEKGVLAGLVALALEAAAVPGLVVDGVTDDLHALGLHLPDPWIVGFDLRFDAAGTGGTVRVLAPESLLGAPPPGAGDAWRTDARLATFRVRADVSLATAVLTPAELGALAPGDVVLPGGDVARGRAFLCVGSGAFALRYDDARLTVADPWRQGVPMAEPNDALARDLTVPVSCRLAQLDLDLRELLELAPGAIIGLHRPLGAPIDLVAGERVVARGELVDVEGELGVRVTEIVR
jgi:type III secretion system YscQ/HrcQ family protein